MSVLQCSDALMAPDLQIWNNAAFVDDHGDSEITNWSLKSNPMDLSQSLQSDDCSKENRSPNDSIRNSVAEREGKERSGKEIDAEIEEIETEISRLSSRLKALRIEKAESNTKTIERPRGRIIPAKFMDQKLIVKEPDSAKKIKAAPKLTRRGVSLGPAEILRSRPLSKAEVTPILSVQSRRKSCFWKLQEVDELKVTKERRKSLSNSPTSRKTEAKTLPQRQAITTVGSKKGLKIEEGVISSIQPKKLFREGEKSAPAKKSVKPGRIVASRYNQITVSAARKRSWPENDKDEVDRSDRKRVSQGTESKVMKKRWEIPREVVLYKSSEEEDKKFGSLETPVTVGRLTEVLPRIRTLKCGNDTPRDSGRAKRVSELVGRRGYFDDSEGELFCQTLSFIEDVEEC